MLLLMRHKRNKSQRGKEEKGKEKEERQEVMLRMSGREKILNYFSAPETPKAIVLPAFFFFFF